MMKIDKRKEFLTQKNYKKNIGKKLDLKMVPMEEHPYFVDVKWWKMYQLVFGIIKTSQNLICTQMTYQKTTLLSFEKKTEEMINF